MSLSIFFQNSMCKTIAEWNKKLRYMYILEYCKALNIQKHKIGYNMDETRGHHAKRNQSEGKINTE